MNFLPLLAALGLLMMPGASRRWLARLHPDESAKLTLTALVGGVLSLVVALALCAAPLIVRVIGLQPGRMIGSEHFFPGGLAAGWFSLTILTLIAIAIASTVGVHVASHRRLRADAVWAEENTVGGVVVKVLPIDTPLAFALHGRDPSVVLSRGTFEGLEKAQLDAVIRHELSHLRHHHRWYLLLAEAVDRLSGRIGPIHRSAAVLRLTLEHWADEEAIVRPGDRLVVRSALTRVGGLNQATVAAFSEAENVSARLDHLAKPPLPASSLTRTLILSGVLGGIAAATVPLLTWLLM